MLYSILVVLLSLLMPCFGGEEKVLVITQSSFLKEAMDFRLQVEGYKVAIASNESLSSPLLIEQLMLEERPDYVIVDGLAESVIDALLIDTQVINAANQIGVKKTIVLASYDIYPKKIELPYKEKFLLEQKIEWLDDPYQIAKLTALKQCHALNGLKTPRFLLCIHPLVYGPKDANYSVHSKHPVKSIAARLIQCNREQKNFCPIANNGSALYELLHVDDLAKAVAFLLVTPSEEEVINIGTGTEVAIEQIAAYAKNHLNFKGRIILDPNCYDDVPRKVLDCTRLSTLGFAPSISLHDGIRETVIWLDGATPQQNLIERQKLELP